jgi:hypothetical protein
MYFLVYGEVAIGFVRNERFVPYMTIGETYYFGEVDLMFSESQTHSDAA